MKPKTSFELWRWSYFVIFWFITMGLIALIGELLVAPLIVWLLNDIPYSLPSWDRAKRWALIILFIGFYAGTLSWYHEKRSNGR